MSTTTHCASLLWCWAAFWQSAWAFTFSIFPSSCHGHTFPASSSIIPAWCLIWLWPCLDHAHLRALLPNSAHPSRWSYLLVHKRVHEMVHKMVCK